MMRLSGQFLRETHGKRFSSSLALVEEVRNLVVTRDSGLEVSGDVGEYGCYICGDSYFCGCMDNFVRKTICKHILALLFAAIYRGALTELELVGLIS